MNAEMCTTVLKLARERQRFTCFTNKLLKQAHPYADSFIDSGMRVLHSLNSSADTLLLEQHSLHSDLIALKTIRDRGGCFSDDQEKELLFCKYRHFQHTWEIRRLAWANKLASLYVRSVLGVYRCAAKIEGAQSIRSKQLLAILDDEASPVLYHRVALWCVIRSRDLQWSLGDFDEGFADRLERDGMQSARAWADVQVNHHWRDIGSTVLTIISGYKVAEWLLHFLRSRF